MSVQALSWALHQAPVTNKSDLLVLIALADCAHPDGDGAYPSVATIAKLARMSVRSAQEALGRLQEAKVIEGTPRKGRTTIYKMPVTPAKAAGVQTSQGRDGSQGRGAKTRSNPCDGSHPNRKNRPLTGEKKHLTGIDALVIES